MLKNAHNIQIQERQVLCKHPKRIRTPWHWTSEHVFPPSGGPFSLFDTPALFLLLCVPGPIYSSGRKSLEIAAGTPLTQICSWNCWQTGQELRSVLFLICAFFLCSPLLFSQDHLKSDQLPWKAAWGRPSLAVFCRQPIWPRANDGLSLPLPPPWDVSQGSDTHTGVAERHFNLAESGKFMEATIDQWMARYGAAMLAIIKTVTHSQSPVLVATQPLWPSPAATKMTGLQARLRTKGQIDAAVALAKPLAHRDNSPRDQHGHSVSSGS